MLTYLEGGWYDPAQKLRLEVLDGAVDAAGLLWRAGVRPQHMETLALRSRALIAITSRHRGIHEALDATDRHALMLRLERYADVAPELFGFVSDCMESIRTPRDLFAFYLHMVHIGRVLQLFSHLTTKNKQRREAASRPKPKTKGQRVSKKAKKATSRSSKPAAKATGSKASKKTTRTTASAAARPKAQTKTSRRKSNTQPARPGTAKKKTGKKAAPRRKINRAKRK